MGSPKKRTDSTSNAPQVDAETYAELRRLAARRLRLERVGHTLQPTALLNEAFLRLGPERGWNDRRHFFAQMARTMRHVLIDYARSRAAAKRGNGERPASLDAVAEPEAPQPETRLLALEAALEKLEKTQPRLGRLVELRFFAGMSIEEAAEAMGLSPATAKRDWAAARLWLAKELDDGAPGSPEEGSDDDTQDP